jgi:hypothetical protein
MIAFPKPPADRLDEWLIAYHESGHAVAASQFGWIVTRLQLEPGKCSVDRSAIIDGPDLWLPRAVVRMAGVVAENFAIRGIETLPPHDMPVDHGNGDIEVVTQLAEEIYPDPDATEERDRFYQDAIKRAFDVVQRHGAVILDLAAELMERRVMDRAAVEGAILASLAKRRKSNERT